MRNYSELMSPLLRYILQVIFEVTNLVLVHYGFVTLHKKIFSLNPQTYQAHPSLEYRKSVITFILKDIFKHTSHSQMELSRNVSCIIWEFLCQRRPLENY